MSKHWKPPGNVVRLRPRSGRGGGSRGSSGGGRRGWTHVGAYVAETQRTWPRGASVGVVLVLAACVGLGVGFYQAQRTDPVAAGAEIEWNAVQAVPTREPDAEDIARARRAEAEDGAPTGSGSARAVQASFGYCHSGGGTNCVVDGDTFYLNGEKVRIAGIDAPETHPARCPHEAALGAAATQKLAELLRGRPLWVSGIKVDHWGRNVAVVRVNGEDVADAMIGSGLARNYDGKQRQDWC